MKDSTITILIVMACLLGIPATYLTLRAAGIVDKKTFGVADQNADTDIYRHSEAYREGLQRDFDELSLAYAQAKPEDKPAVLATIRHRAEGAPPEYVPANIRSLIAR
jgi:hypothetical protein